MLNNREKWWDVECVQETDLQPEAANTAQIFQPLRLKPRLVV